VPKYDKITSDGVYGQKTWAIQKLINPKAQDEIIEFIEKYKFSVAISHDGPNQKIRGPDPFDDPIKKELILTIIKSMVIM
jgi:hypothetical protein